MATNDSTAPALNSTPAQLAEQFPLTCDPFAVWYSLPESGEKWGEWTINDGHGDGVYTAGSFNAAVKLSRALIASFQPNAGAMANNLGEVCDILCAMKTLMPHINYDNQIDLDTGMLPVKITMAALIDKADAIATPLWERELERLGESQKNDEMEVQHA